MTHKQLVYSMVDKKADLGAYNYTIAKSANMTTASVQHILTGRRCYIDTFLDVVDALGMEIIIKNKETGGDKLKDDDFNAYKKQATIAARELCYGPQVIADIGRAKSIGQIEHIMVSTRKGKEY